MCKSTQDLTMFIQELSAIRNAQVVVSIYPDKSFVLYQTDITGATLEPIYQSDTISDGMDINDLPYEDAREFSTHIDELASIESILDDTKPSKGPVSLDDI